MKKNSGLADSPFFKSPAPPKQPQAVFDSDLKSKPSKKTKKTRTEAKSERKSERTEIRSEFRTPSLPTKRRTTRYSFEFYEDQLVKIKRLKYEAEQSGQKLTLSDIARQAFDEYLKDK